MTAVRKIMSPDEFLTWCLDQEGRWELVNGHPVQVDVDPTHMMAGATENHDAIVVNLLTLLRERLRGGPCRPKTADQAARMPKGNIRRPDVTVDCGPRDSGSLASIEPAVFFEVLSHSTRLLDQARKPEEYKEVPTLKHFVLLEPGAPRAVIWTREANGWTNHDVEGLDGELDLAAIGVRLRLADVYDGVALIP